MNKELRADARLNGGQYVVNLRDRNDPWGEWFESDIQGTYDHCYSQVRGGSLDMHFDVQIVEAS